MNAPSPSSMQPRQAAAPASAPVASIDPIKLLTRYRWLLIGAVFGGLIFGLLMHLLLMRVYPIWSAQALFEALPVQASAVIPVGAQQTDDVALDRFMQTQARMMTSNVVLQRVAEDSRLPTEAPAWCKRFYAKNGVFNTAEAFMELQDKVGARVVPQTAMIELGMSYQDKKDVTAIVKLCKDAYMSVLRKQVNSVNANQIQSLRQSLEGMDTQQKEIQGRRERLVTDYKLDTINRQSSEANDTLRIVNQEVTKLDLDLQQYGTQLSQMEQDLANPGGVRFSDALRDEVETDPLIMQVKQTVNSLESERRSLLQRVTPEHMQSKQLEKTLNGYKQNLEAQREVLLRQKFDARLDQLRKVLDQLRAQQKDLSDKKTTLGTRLTELTRIQQQVEDFDSQIRQLIETRNKTEAELRQLVALESMPTNQRVQVAVDEREPDEVSFPKLQIMLPAGVLLVLAGVIGSLVVREMVDQRVKGPSDVALIPKARVLGIVPDAQEDPSGVGNVATAFRDKDRGVMAECFRHLRAAILKRTQQMGHKTVLIVGGMPGSGSTIVTSNLAFAISSADRRVLVIDANMRRPMQHKVFGVNDAPGLADLLDSSGTFDQVVQKTADEHVDVLSAGSRDKRDFERLSTDAMSAILRQAREKYDLVLVDAPPLIVSGDGMALAARCDASILVIRAMQEKRGMVARLRSELADAKAELLGVLVNGVQSSAGGYLRGNLKATHEYQTQAA